MRAFLRIILGLAVLAVAISVAALAPARADTSATSDAALLAAAKHDGSVTWYSSLPLEYSNKLAHAFTAKYGIPVKVFVTGSLRLQNKLYEEIRVGHVEADVFHSSYPPAFLLFKKLGAFAKYHSPEYSAYPAPYVDPDFTYGTMRVTVLVLMYNKTALGNRPVPQKWQDLLNPDLKGLIVSASPQYGGTQLIQYMMLKKKYGDDFVRGLAAQQPMFVEAQGAESNMIVTGERAVGIDMNDYEAWSTKYRRGAKVDFTYPDNVAVVPGNIAVLAKAPHPNAGRLLMNYLLSKEGQAAVQTLVGAYSARSDAPPIPHRPAFSSLNAWQPDWSALETGTAALQASILKLLH